MQPSPIAETQITVSKALALTSHSSRKFHRLCRFKGSHIDTEAVLHIDSGAVVVGFVDPGWDD